MSMRVNTAMLRQAPPNVGLCFMLASNHMRSARAHTAGVHRTTLRSAVWYSASQQSASQYSISRQDVSSQGTTQNVSRGSAKARVNQHLIDTVFLWFRRCISTNINILVLYDVLLSTLAALVLIIVLLSVLVILGSWGVAF
jgi:hypothetical protein